MTSPTLSYLSRVLRLIPKSQRVSACASAFQMANEADASALVEAISSRLNEEAAENRPLLLAAMVDEWSRLNESARSCITTLTSFDPKRESTLRAGSNSPRVRKSALELAIMSDHLAVMASLVGDPDKSIATRASDSLLRTVRLLVSKTDTARTLEVRGALASLLRRFDEHRSVEAVRAACITESAHTGRADQLSALLIDRGAPFVGVLAALLRKAESPQMASLAWRWLKLPHLAAACMDGLSRAKDQRWLSGGSAHLALHPSRQSRLAMMGRADTTFSWLTRAAATLAADSAGCVGLTIVGNGAGAPAGVRDAMTPDLLRPGNASARLAGMRFASSKGLADFVFDPDERVARGASIRLSQIGTGDKAADDASVRLRSPHESVRSMAAQDLAREGLLAISDAAGTVKWRAWLAADAGAAEQALVQQLEHEDERRVRHAVTIARRLKLTSRLTPVLGEAAARTGAGVYTIALIATALGDSSNLHATRILAGMLRHHDQRVRANAVESIAKRARGRTSGVLEHKNDTNHRVRANAIRGVLLPSLSDAQTIDLRSARDAANESIRMLNDEREMHRVAAMWLLERLGRTGAGPLLGDQWGQMLAIAREAAAKDESPHVRARATASLASERRERKAA